MATKNATVSNLGVRVHPTVLRRALRNALLFASPDEHRPVLKSVLIEAHPEEGLLLVATDSYRMVRIEVPTVDREGAAKPLTGVTGSWLVPVSLVALWVNALPTGRRLPFETVALTLKLTIANLTIHQDASHSLHTGPVIVRGRLSSGEYPQWRTVWDAPPKNAGPFGQFALNQDLLRGLTKVVNMETGKTDHPMQFRMPTSPLDPIHVDFGAGTKAMIMPVRIA